MITSLILMSQASLALFPQDKSQRNSSTIQASEEVLLSAASKQNRSLKVQLDRATLSRIATYDHITMTARLNNGKYIAFVRRPEIKTDDLLSTVTGSTLASVGNNSQRELMKRRFEVKDPPSIAGWRFVMAEPMERGSYIGLWKATEKGRFKSMIVSFVDQSERCRGRPRYRVIGWSHKPIALVSIPFMFHSLDFSIIHALNENEISLTYHSVGGPNLEPILQPCG